MRAALRSLVLRRLGGSAAPALPYTLDIDLTSSLDSRITFTRAGTRNYINAGVLTALATGLPAFESWDGVDRGLAIEPGFTNLLTYSNDFTNAIWTLAGMSTPVAGDSASGVITQLSRIDATATANFHTIRQKPGSQASGVRQTWSVFAKLDAGSTNHTVYLKAAAEFNDTGVRCAFRIDGNDGFIPIEDSATMTDTIFRYRKMTDNVYMLSITGTWTATGNKQVHLGVVANTLTEGRNYTAVTTHRVQVFGASLTTTNGPVGYVATGAATASQAAESAIFNDTSWLTTAEGTFVVEHDCWSGPIIGSGANTVLGATVPGKTAIAWSGVTSDTVNNGGSASSSTQPTFSGSDVRLLSTSGASNAGHIKSIRFYPTRLSVAEMQALTAPTASTATPGVLRTVSVDNRLPAGINTTAGSALTFKSRFRLKLGAHACSELYLDFPNIRWAGGTPVGNDLNITKVVLERVTGVAEYVPVTRSASRSFVVPDGANATCRSDVLLPSDYTGLTTEFPAHTEFMGRLEGTVSSAGHIIMGCRQSETGGWGRIYNPATVSFSDVDGTGPITRLSGSDPGQLTQSYMPILVGKFVDGDPKTLFVVGDSIIEGTSGLGTTGTFVNLACRNLGIPKLEMSQGGKSQLEAAATAANWTPYLKYCRVLLDEFGTNNPNAMLEFFAYWEAAKTTHGYDKIIKLGLFPRTTSSDSFATEANQTITNAYPANYPDLSSIQWLKYGLIDYNIDPQSVRGTNKAKWKVNGAAFYSTTDGTHQSGAGNDLLAAEVEPILSAVTVT